MGYITLAVGAPIPPSLYSVIGEAKTIACIAKVTRRLQIITNELAKDTEYIQKVVTHNTRHMTLDMGHRTKEPRLRTKDT